jgi:hypothetical protein
MPLMARLHDALAGRAEVPAALLGAAAGDARLPQAMAQVKSVGFLVGLDQFCFTK